MLIEDCDTQCEIHDLPLSAELVLVKYGLYRFSADFSEAHRKLFPNSRFFVLGGCMLGEQLWHKVHFCEACRRAHKQWCVVHESDEGLPPSDSEITWTVQRYLDDPSFSGVVPEEVEACINAGKDTAAIMHLKVANPNAEIALLRRYVHFRKKKASYEAVMASHLLEAR